jgi:hypothetical protein
MPGADSNAKRRGTRGRTCRLDVGDDCVAPCRIQPGPITSRPSLFLRECIRIATPIQSPALNLLPPCATAHGVRATQCKAKNACLSGNLTGWAANRTNKRARIAQRPARSQNRPLESENRHMSCDRRLLSRRRVWILSLRIYKERVSIGSRAREKPKRNSKLHPTRSHVRSLST